MLSCFNVSGIDTSPPTGTGINASPLSGLAYMFPLKTYNRLYYIDAFPRMKLALMLPHLQGWHIYFLPLQASDECLTCMLTASF